MTISKELLDGLLKGCERLGENGCFDDPFPSKPKGMHWRTYEKLERQCEAYENQVAAQFMYLLHRFEGRVGPG